MASSVLTGRKGTDFYHHHYKGQEEGKCLWSPASTVQAAIPLWQVLPAWQAATAELVELLRKLETGKTAKPVVADWLSLRHCSWPTLPGLQIIQLLKFYYSTRIVQVESLQLQSKFLLGEPKITGLFVGL